MARMRKCAYKKCGKRFEQRYPNQKYCCYDHKNSANQARIRKRAKEHGELAAALHGPVGSSD